ncbi:MAG TPA: methyltransferase domain-containing protein [Dongiaceae bacterium]|nr:methyltransferase domain-containing protein [Dongiaceae bacterium]
MLELPFSLIGKRVLDLGTRDGFFAFEAEKRGAEVVAVDYLPAHATGFALAAGVLQANVTYVQENVFNCTPERFGTFDIVFMLGLLYHLRDPLGALDVVRDLARDRVYLETYVCDEGIDLPDGSRSSLLQLDSRLAKTPMMVFLPGASLNADPSNFWAPNAACVEAMMTEANFTVHWLKRAQNRVLAAADVAGDEGRLYQRRIARGEEHPAQHDEGEGGRDGQRRDRP